MRCIRLVVIVPALIAILGPSKAGAEVAGADSFLEQAVAAYDDLRMEDALGLLEQAEAAGGLEAPSEARLFLYRGLSQSGLGRQDEAAGQFRAALTIDADLELPGGTSPVVVERFQQIRDELGSREPEVPVPPPIELVPPTQTTTAALPSLPPPAPPRLIATWLFVGLSAAALVAGGTAAVLAEVTRATITEREHAQYRVDEHLATYQTEARIAFGCLSAAAALAVTTLLVWLGERQPQATTQPTTATMGPGLAGLQLAGWWR